MNHLYKRLFYTGLVILPMLFASEKAIAQVPIIEWAKSAGGLTNNDIGLGLAVDAAKNTYVTGLFEESCVFGQDTLTSIGDYDVFVAKYDLTGNIIWVKRFGGTDLDQGTSIVADATGNSYVTGHFFGTSTFGNFTLSSEGMSDIFTLKLDGQGNVLWAKQGGGIHHDWDRDITLDYAGNVYITGRFQGTATFESQTLVSSGWDDMYIIKYDQSGNLIWSRTFGGAESDVANSIEVDNTGNLYITGEFAESVIFGTDTLVSVGANDIFLAKLNSSGNTVWAKKAVSQGMERSFGVAVDNQGNSYITGETGLTINFEATTLTSSGWTDVFIAKYNSAGNLVWAQLEGGTGNDYSYDISVDASDNFYIIGHFYNTAQFGNTTIASSGITDMYVTKYSPNGNPVWVKQVGGTGIERGYRVTTDIQGNCYILGSYENSVVANGSTTLTSNGLADILLAKIALSDISALPKNPATPSTYPNPFTSSFQIPLTGTAPATATLTDMLGRQVHQQVISAVSRSTIATLTPPGNLPSGIYILQIQEGEKLIQTRVVKE